MAKLIEEGRRRIVEPSKKVIKLNRYLPGRIQFTVLKVKKGWRKPWTIEAGIQVTDVNGKPLVLYEPQVMQSGDSIALGGIEIRQPITLTT